LLGDFVDAEARAGSDGQTAESIAISVARTPSILGDAAGMIWPLVTDSSTDRDLS
jgi:hypothetical protein